MEETSQIFLTGTAVVVAGLILGANVRSAIDEYNCRRKSDGRKGIFRQEEYLGPLDYAAYVVHNL